MQLEQFVTSNQLPSTTHECWQLLLQRLLQFRASSSLGLRPLQRCAILRAPLSMQERLLLWFRHRQHRRSSWQLLLPTRRQCARMGLQGQFPWRWIRRRS